MRGEIPPATPSTILTPPPLTLDRNTQYGLTLPRRTVDEAIAANATPASDLLRAHADSRGFTTGAGEPDESRSARILLKDFVNGRVRHGVPPPGAVDLPAVHSLPFEQYDVLTKDQAKMSAKDTELIQARQRVEARRTKKAKADALQNAKKKSQMSDMERGLLLGAGEASTSGNNNTRKRQTKKQRLAERAHAKAAGRAAAEADDGQWDDI